MSKIASLFDGKELDNPTAVSKRKCEFGQWLYNDNNKLQRVLGTQFYENIETTHAKWHAEYMRIFEIFFKNKNKSFFVKLISSNKITEMELDKAKLYHSELLETTSELLKILASSERRIMALSETKFY